MPKIKGWTREKDTGYLVASWKNDVTPARVVVDHESIAKVYNVLQTRKIGALLIATKPTKEEAIKAAIKHIKRYR